MKAGKPPRRDPLLTHIQIKLALLIKRVDKKCVDISFNLAKRAATLRDRGLDFADAGTVFEGRTVTVQDNRLDYCEDRFITAGHLDGHAWCSSGRRAATAAASSP